MNGLTEPLDLVTKYISPGLGLRPEDVSVPVGSIAIGETVSYLERKFVRGWIRPVILAVGAGATFVAAAKTTNSRLKEEGLIIGADLLINAVKDAVENRNEVIETVKGTVEAVKSAISNVAGSSTNNNSTNNNSVNNNSANKNSTPTPEEELKVIAF